MVARDEQDNQLGKQSSLQSQIQKNKFFKDRIREARMQREERVVTNICVNSIVPFAILGLLANFIP
jgi:hypothetical protein